MKELFNKLLIVDGSYLLHRQLHQQTIFDLRSPNGERSGGVFGFLRSLNKEILNIKDYFPVVVFDHGLSQRRVALDYNYKHASERNNMGGNEVITEEELDNDYITQYRKQRSKLADILPYFGIPVIMFSGWEGDDLIYILSRLSKNSIVLTDDRDMLQLLDNNCDIRRPMADEYWTLNNFLESRGFIDTFDFVINKAILGDGSDNIPSSCKGVGEKYVLSLIRILRRYSVNRYNNKWFDMSDYPVDESGMRDLCNKLGVPYRKAFLNLDRDRFITNMGLVDLSLVEFEDRIIDSIRATMTHSSDTSNFFNLLSSLNSLGIHEVPVDTIIESVSSRRRNLMI